MKNILLLEDDPSLLKLYTYGMKYAGYTVTPVSTLEDLQDRARYAHFDLCVSDLNIGARGADDMIGALAQLQREYGFPVLIVSGSANKHAALCQQAGLYFLQKPFINSVMISAMERIMQTAVRG